MCNDTGPSWDPKRDHQDPGGYHESPPTGKEDAALSTPEDPSSGSESETTSATGGWHLQPRANHPDW